MSPTMRQLLSLLVAVVAIPAVLFIVIYLGIQINESTGLKLVLAYARAGTLGVAFLGLVYIALKTSTRKEKKDAALLGSLFGAAFLNHVFGDRTVTNLEGFDSQKEDESSELEKKKGQGKMVARFLLIVSGVYVLLEVLAYVL